RRHAVRARRHPQATEKLTSDLVPVGNVHAHGLGIRTRFVSCVRHAARARLLSSGCAPTQVRSPIPPQPVTLLGLYMATRRYIAFTPRMNREVYLCVALLGH